MLDYVLLYALTAAIFLLGDLLVLPRLVLPLFQKALGQALAAPFRYGPAVVFYLFFIAAVLWLVTGPALQAGTGLARVALDAAVLGLAAYGTYEFTNLATIRGWTWRMLVTDLTWGVTLTTGSAVVALALVRSVG